MKERMLRVCLDARLVEGVSGGTQQAVIGLACGLSEISDGLEVYQFLVYEDAHDWLKPFLGGTCRALPCGRAPRTPWKRRIRALPGARRLVDATYWLAGRQLVRLPQAPEVVTPAAIDVMHFTCQLGFLISVPSIYQPWDLQHLHLPELFPTRARVHREVTYRAFCRQAQLVVCPTQWGKRDLIAHYQLPPNKICVVPCAPVNRQYPIPSPADLAATRERLQLPPAFAYYPAQTWKHKNHLTLLDAIALLRDKYDIRVPLVCSGGLNDFYPTIRRRMEELGLADAVRFLGFVSPLELQCLYRLCRCVVLPTLFEGWGMPLLEAYQAGAPVACSAIGPLLEQAEDGALLFDPRCPLNIASALRALWADGGMRAALAQRGLRIVGQYSWERTARVFRAHYRRLAGRPLTEEDKMLLEVPAPRATALGGQSARLPLRRTA